MGTHTYKRVSKCWESRKPGKFPPGKMKSELVRHQLCQSTNSRTWEKKRRKKIQWARKKEWNINLSEQSQWTRMDHLWTECGMYKWLHNIIWYMHTNKSKPVRAHTDSEWSIYLVPITSERQRRMKQEA